MNLIICMSHFSSFFIYLFKFLALKTRPATPCWQDLGSLTAHCSHPHAGWLKRRPESVTPDTSPTSQLACPHGNMIPGVGAGAAAAARQAGRSQCQVASSVAAAAAARRAGRPQCQVASSIAAAAATRQAVLLLPGLRASGSGCKQCYYCCCCRCCEAGPQVQVASRAHMYRQRV